MLIKEKGNYMKRKHKQSLRLRLKQSLRSKKDLKIPKFKNEDTERKFWSKLDLAEYFEPSDFVEVSFPNLKPTTRPISIRLPEHLLIRLKEKANEVNIPYQSLIKTFISRGLQNT